MVEYEEEEVEKQQEWETAEALEAYLQRDLSGLRFVEDDDLLRQTSRLALKKGRSREFLAALHPLASARVESGLWHAEMVREMLKEHFESFVLDEVLKYDWRRGWGFLLNAQRDWQDPVALTSEDLESMTRLLYRAMVAHGLLTPLPELHEEVLSSNRQLLGRFRTVPEDATEDMVTVLGRYFRGVKTATQRSRRERFREAVAAVAALGRPSRID